MNNEDLYVSNGPVSSMPGSVHSLPVGTKCDAHPDCDAVKRIQGETDSFGCEYVMMCQECVEAAAKWREDEAKKESYCDWCASRKIGCRPRRDIDEGSAGRLYNVCGDCIRKENERLAKEAEEYYKEHGDDFDDFD